MLNRIIKFICTGVPWFSKTIHSENCSRRLLMENCIWKGIIKILLIVPTSQVYPVLTCFKQYKALDKAEKMLKHITDYSIAYHTKWQFITF